MAEQVTGGCQCGRIRYRVAVDQAEAYLCHCKMCRKATGGASIAFVGVPLAAITWEGVEPDAYRSSPIAERPFCSTCGTPLGFRFTQDARNMDLTLGSFDDPGRFVPVHNYASESILPAWLDASHLPNIRSEENVKLTEKWIAAVGKVPE
jgi:hypothetical protein